MSGHNGTDAQGLLPVNKFSKPTKDCRVCNRRRIKCDRSTPSCKKCASKKLTCPGYGIILNWEWGVASRGRFAGKTVPSLPKAGASTTRIQDKATSPSPILESSSEDESAVSTNSAVESQPRLPMGLDSVPNSISGILQDSTSRHLFHHYEQSIATSMVWVDGPDNAWRTTIMPMALQSTPLLISVLAFAAEHLSAVLPENAVLKDTLTHRAKQYRDSALSLLTSDMQSAAITSETMTASESGGGQRNDLANSVLASMLVLCNMETVRPESRLWRVHLDAARTIVNLRTNKPFPKDETFNFLVQQFFITDVFACTTNFVQIDAQEILTEDASSVFIEFLKLVRRVTWLEREAATQGLPNPGAGIPSSTLRNMFEKARDCTLTLSACLPFASPTEREQFLGVVQSFHHAGLLYGYRCLSYPDSEEEISKSRLALFQCLDLVQSDHPAFAQNLVWPLFIAGTEAQGPDGTQVLVEQKLNQAMRRTGFSNCKEALTFLRLFWIARDGGESNLSSVKESDSQHGTGNKLNWIHCARYWTSHGNQFLVY